MHFSITLIVIALTASMSVSACFNKGQACQKDIECCDGIPCNVSMSRLSCVQGSNHDSLRVVVLIGEHLPKSLRWYPKCRMATVTWRVMFINCG
jgi:hypothetical protein